MDWANPSSSVPTGRPIDAERYPSAERILLIRPGALGDALLTFPALALLRRARPGAHVTLIARRDVLPLARASLLADATSAYDDPAWSVLFAEEPPQRGAAFEQVNGSIVVAWLGDHGADVHHALAHLGAARVVIAASRPAEGSGLHVALHLARTLVPLGVVAPATLRELASLLPPLCVPEAENAAAASTWRSLNIPDGARVVALHAGSGGAAKRWPPRSFAVAAAELRSAGYFPLLLAGPQEDEVTSAVLAALTGNPVAVVGRLTLGALASLLPRCAAYLGNDSGPTHLAALAGVPVVALFGPSDPACWSPLGPRVTILRSPTPEIAGLAVDEVLSTLFTLLASG